MTYSYYVTLPYTNELIRGNRLLYLNEYDGRLNIIYSYIYMDKSELERLKREFDVLADVEDKLLRKYLNVVSSSYECDRREVKDDLVIYKIEECTVTPFPDSAVEEVLMYDGNFLTSESEPPRASVVPEPTMDELLGNLEDN